MRTHTQTKEITMTIWTMMLLLLLPASALATPTSYQFEGTLASGEALSAQWTVDLASQPLAYNVRNLSPNTTYGIASSITGGGIGGSGFTEFCTGHCVFAGPDMDTLRLSNGVQELQLTFRPGLSEWIENGSWLKVHRPDGGYSLTFFNQESVRYASVPEPTSGWLFAIGLAMAITGVYYYGFMSERR